VAPFSLRPVRLLPILVLPVWALTVAAGFATLLAYEAAPGSSGAPPRDWPAGSRLRPATDRPTLVLFAHPQCPCTRASVAELAAIMTRCPDRTAAFVYFFRPAGKPPEWCDTDLWREATRIPGVEVAADVDGREAAAFGVETSGHVLLFDRAGRLRFGGGITASRGHEGDNPGRAAVVAVLTGVTPEVRSTPVFGCPILTPRP